MLLIRGEVLPVLLRSVDIRQDSGIVNRQLEPLTKIAADNGPSPLGEICFQKLGKKGAAEENRVPAPSFEGRDDKGRPGFDMSGDQCSHSSWGE